MLCATNGNTQCTPGGQLTSYDCEPIGQTCEKPGDICTVAKLEVPLFGWNVVPTTGEVLWPDGGPTSATCTAEPHPNPKCEAQQYCDPRKMCCPTIGDPISVKDDNTVHHVEDLRVATSLGALTFERSFTSSPYAYSWLDVPLSVKPFGTSPVSPQTMHWTHNWHSMVKDLDAQRDGGVSGASGYAVLDTNGMIGRFARCAPKPCYAAPVNPAASGDMLYVEDARVTLLREHVGRFVYETAADYSRLYLSRWEDSQNPAAGESPRSRATLSYATPIACPEVTPNGVPYLSNVEAADGTKLVVTWGSSAASGGCYIQGVAVGKGAATQSAVSYSLTQAPNVLSLVASYGTDGGAGGESYTFTADAGWIVRRDGVQVARHTYGGTRSDYGQGDVEMFRKGTTAQLACPLGGCDAAVSYNWTEYVPVSQQTTRGPRARTVTMASVQSLPQPVLTSTDEACAGSECFGSVSRPLGYASTPAGLKVASARNGRGAYTVNAFDAGVMLPTGQQRVELVSTAEGATSASGTSPLLSSEYSYAYGSVGKTPRGWEQYVAEERRPSLLSTGEQTRFATRRDPATNRVTAELRSGWTMEFTPATATWATVSRTIGTFYFTQRKCTGSAADPLGRTLEVHGPCIVGDAAATDCPVGTTFPVTQFGYYPADAADPVNAQRLEYERRWVSVSDPASCAGVSMTTTYGSYDVRGSPGTVTDPNGVVTILTYEDGHLVTSTVDGKTTSYSWDNGKLTAVRHPEGNYDVYCYRQAALGTACSRALPATQQLQWEAKAPNADGTGYTEGRAYFYLADGRRVREELWDGVRNEKRQQRTFEENARGQNTRTLYGLSQGPFNALRRYDADGNLTGYNSATGSPDCGQQAQSGVSGSSTCANLRLDGLGRVLSMDVAAATSGSTGRTCIAYDAHGNVSSVKQGCPSDSLSYPGPDCATCTQPASRYVADDFGNVVSMTLPHLGNGSAGGDVRLAFDALGMPLYRQTPSMSANSAFHSFTYDGLGRLLAAYNRRVGSSPSNETLYSMTYDNAAVLDASCPQPSRTMGRLLRRIDTFGETWFQYSPEGRVLGEVRVRLGGGCSGVLPRNVPHAFYTYTANGNLSSMQYPYGRTVTYGYGTAGGVTTDRISSITVTKWDGASWVPWQALQSIAWEPFGDVRAWQLNGDSGPLGVENIARQSVGTYVGSTCPMSRPADNDLSGRVQLVQVSTGALTIGGGTGNVFQRFLNADTQGLRTEGSCWAASGPVEQVSYSYAPGDQVIIGAGVYDVRGNRTQMYVSRDTFLYSDAGVTDRLVEWRRPGVSSALLPVSYGYDDDGRTTSIRLGNDSSGTPAAQETWTPASPESGSGGLDSVYKSVSISGAVYSYYYDATNRRRLKRYPTGVSDEYFYSQGNQLLVDRGNAALLAPEYNTTDEYVWLGGRPVLVMRGRLGATDDARGPDTTTVCGRNGESQACGAYFIITDPLPKPIALLDSNGKHARKLKWDAFGQLNRTQVRGATRHPYPANDYAVLLQMSPAVTTMPLAYRYQFDGLDSEGTSAAPVDSVVIKQQSQTVKTLGGYHQGRVTSSWIPSDGGYISIIFQSGPRSCPPTGCLADGGLPDAGNWSYAGADLVGYETVERDVAAKPFDINLRFPGQYFDAETLKHENWNRYYDPSTGRYLSPEPLLQEPNFVRHMATRGLGTPTYVYALNNPVRYKDRNGLFLGADDAMVGFGILEFASVIKLLEILDNATTPVEALGPQLGDPLAHPPTRYLPPRLHDTPGPMRPMRPRHPSGRGYPSNDPRCRQGQTQGQVADCKAEASYAYYRCYLAGYGVTTCIAVALDLFEECAGFRMGEAELRNSLGF